MGAFEAEKKVTEYLYECWYSDEASHCGDSAYKPFIQRADTASELYARLFYPMWVIFLQAPETTHPNSIDSRGGEAALSAP
jgi:hypothetical protein